MTTAVHVDFAYPSSDHAAALGRAAGGCYVVVDSDTADLVIGEPFDTVQAAELAAADSGFSFSWLHVQAIRRGTR